MSMPRADLDRRRARGTGASGIKCSLLERHALEPIPNRGRRKTLLESDRVVKD